MKFKDLSESEQKKYKKFICNTKEFQDYINAFIDNFNVDNIIQEYQDCYDNICSIQEFSRSLKNKVLGYENISGNKLYNILEKHNIIYKKDYWTAKDEFITKGYFVIDKRTNYIGDHAGEISYTTKLTPKGQDWLINNLEKHNYIKRVSK